MRGSSQAPGTRAMHPPHSSGKRHQAGACVSPSSLSSRISLPKEHRWPGGRRVPRRKLVRVGFTGTGVTDTACHPQELNEQLQEANWNVPANSGGSLRPGRRPRGHSLSARCVTRSPRAVGLELRASLPLGVSLAEIVTGSLRPGFPTSVPPTWLLQARSCEKRQHRGSQGGILGIKPRHGGASVFARPL